MMHIHRHGSGPAQIAPEPGFTGDVEISGYFQRSTPSRLWGAAATFPPATRTPWKTNAGGQTVVVTSGTGRAQSEGEDVIEIGVGDVLWFEPGVRHWEGAAPDASMTYVAMHEDGVDFGEAVTDEEYGRLG